MKNIALKIIDTFFLLRITLLVPVWTVLLLGWITGSAHIGIGGIFCSRGGNEQLFWIVLTGFSLIVASIYVVNQIMDIESDRINHKLFILPRGLLSVTTAWICAVSCAALGLVISVLFIDSIMTVLFCLSLLLGVCYNLKPISLKDRAWGGVIANFIGHGVLTYLVGWYAAQMDAGLSQPLLTRGVVASLSAGFANAAVFLTTTIPDAAGDASTGKKTFCVTYGPKNTAIAAALSCGLALVFALTCQYNAWVMIIPSILSLILFIMFVFSTNRELAFKTFRWPVFILSLFVALFVPIYSVVVLFTVFISRLYYKKRFNFDYPTLKSK